MPKDILTKIAGEQITNPNFSPSGESQQLADPAGAPSVDFTDATNDVSKTAKLTLGSYLAVKSKKNEYPIAFPVPGAVDPIVKSRGENAALSAADNNGQKAYAADSKAQETLKSAGLGVKQSSELVGQNRLMTFFDQGQIDDVLSKNASDTSKLGHTLLSSVPTDTVNPVGKQLPSSPARQGGERGDKLLRYIHEQLVAGNTFSPDPGVKDRKPFLQNPGGKDEEEITRGLFSIQRNLGHFDVNGQRVQVSDMSAMAMALLLRSVGNDEAASTILKNESFSGTSASVLKIVIRTAQFGATGQGIDAYRLSNLKNISTGPNASKAAAATGQDDFIINLNSDNNLITRGTQPNISNLPNLQSSPSNAGSYSQLNTFLEPFAVGTRFSSTGMFTMALASTLVMIGVGLVIDAISVLAGPDNAPAAKDTPNEMKFGSHRAEGPIASSLSKLLQITRTDYDFGDCVGVGIAALYGLSNNSSSTVASLSSPSSALVIAENLILAGGFYANFTRRMIASAVNVSNIFAKSFGKDTGGSAVQGIEGLLRGIESLLDSVVYKFIMVAAGVGDAALKSEFGMMDTAYTERILKSPYAFEIKKTDPNGKEILTGGGQLGVYRRQLYRWDGAGKRTNALSLKTFFAAQKYPDAITPLEASNRKLIPTRDMVESIENAIESEYMPFYIHDLRTHEVMSMPAFITEFGESFNANYNSVDGIGRQDSVRLYQKTERSVTFGFMLVAFNDEDQDHLWWTVNKLVAMCYPQYSAGRTREVDDANGNTVRFTQPFSQVQAASPMVRLRLGDVFKSNYSKFGLARLFGAGSDRLKITKTAAKNVEEYKKEYESALVDARSRIRVSLEEKIFANDNDFNAAAVNLPIGTEVVLGNVGQAHSPNGSPIKGVTIAEGTIATLQEVVPWKKGKGLNEILPGFNVLLKDNPEIGLISYISGDSIIKVTDAYVEKLANAEPNVIISRQKLETSSTGTTSPTENKDFLSSGENAIVRSFESTRGRGVAGFITSLGLDYGMNSYPWSIKQGSRAPMVVKISLGFAPITDLPLGLDYDGMIRNPSHPVGNIAGGFGDVYVPPVVDNIENFTPVSLTNVQDTIKVRSKADEADKEIKKSFGQGLLDNVNIF